MFRDRTKHSQNEPSDSILLPIKRFFKKSDASHDDLELRRRKYESTSQKELTICVRNAYKNYGAFINQIKVLEGIDMTVAKGDIYGLLGASGCGKTTLLNCILGRRRLNSGQIWVLGGTPGSKASGVPGPRVGYMPQATSLYGEFTASETMYYYGWVAGLSSTEVKQRYYKLRELLMLPDTKQLVKDLSGGQQRRVSLAVALLHEPELLILDEPTVGVDPVLRETIWEHLLKLTSNKSVTIIITTHYIEEARQANTVGLMRGGYLLAEEHPEKLITRYGAQSLEEVFLRLSIRQNEGCSTDIAVSVDSSNNLEENTQSKNNELEYLPEMPPENTYVTELTDYLPRMKSTHMKALIWKGILWMWRNLPAMFCVIMLPVTQIPIFILAIGNDPVDLRVAVTNYETNNTIDCNDTITCYSDQLSCIYLRYLEKRALNLIYFDSEEDARRSVLRAETYASFVVRHNYSDAMRNRIEMWDATKPWDMAAAEIDVFRDVTNKHMALQLKVYLYDTFQKFAQDFAESCEIDRRVLSVPFAWKTPVYGEPYPNFTDYALPGLLIILTFFLAVASTSFGMLIERNEGSFERTFVIGVSEIELLSAHLIHQSFITASQMVMSLLCAFLFFKMTVNGSIVIVGAHVLLTGFVGMAYGMLVSCICDREETATYMALGSVLPMLFLCGTAWPVQALHPLLKPIAYVLPLTPATEAFRSILQRGWGLLYKTVYMGFLTMGLWVVIFLTVSLLFLKFKKS